MRILTGQAEPLGVSLDSGGANFALFSEHAAKVELCLFDPASGKEASRGELPGRTKDVWHGYVPGVKAGQLYGYRVHGPYEPKQGRLFDPTVLVIDPYAKAIGGKAASAPLGAAVSGAFDWLGDRPPRRIWDEAVIYELHVKGFTKLHPDLPEALRGTYAGLGSEPVLRHLRQLGVTAVELMPVHYHVDEESLKARGLTNYWGYSTIGFFAPDPRYATNPSPEECLREFKAMVRSLHQAGIEVILDVVYNHTGEGNERGATLSFKGIDNPCYYRLYPENSSRYEDFTGCLNTLNVRHPRVRELVLQSLRYWVLEMHVDGFRFDLAVALGRGERDFSPWAPLLQAVGSDPALSTVKLIAEPWDLGPGGYQLGKFPAPWREWNARYRDGIRRFWRWDGEGASELATRLSGSSDLFAQRGPSAGINYVTCHDGFTLRDLVSYDFKHNEANGEGNADGERENLSWNCGVEGETDDPVVNALRQRQRRNLLATLFLSQGVPMLCAGDELGRTQRGNNNAYCQDSELSWLRWDPPDEEWEFLGFVRRLIALRREIPALRRKDFFRGEPMPSGVKDILWLAPNGREMAAPDWGDQTRAFGAQLAERQPEALLILFNAQPEAVPFTLPELSSSEKEQKWELLLDTAHMGEPRLFRAGEQYQLLGRSLAVLRSA